MALRKWMMALALLAAGGLLASCGGGGGGGDETSGTIATPVAADPAPSSTTEGPPAPGERIVFDPPILSATVRTGGGYSPDMPLAQVAVVFAKVSRIDSPQVYLYALSGQQVIGPERIEVTNWGGDRYRVGLPLNASLPPGTYTGKLTIKICYDAACTVQHPASGSELPYEIQALPDLTFTVRVNGALVTERPVVLKSGSVLSVESSEPVRWADWYFGTSDLVQTDTTWTATLRFGDKPKWQLSADTLAKPIATRRLALEVIP